MNVLQMTPETSSIRKEEETTLADVISAGTKADKTHQE